MQPFKQQQPILEPFPPQATAIKDQQSDMTQDLSEQHKHYNIGNDYIRGFLRGAVLQGYDPEQLLKLAGINPNVYGDSHATIDGEQFQRLLYTLQQEMNDIFMGFMAQPGRPGLDKEQARVRFQCDTLGETLMATTRFREAVRNDIRYDYINDSKRYEFTLAVNYQTHSDVDNHLWHWHRLLLIYKFYCWLVGQRIKLNRVCFTASQPNTERNAEIYQAFGCEVLFNQPINALSFNKGCLSYPIVRSEIEQMTFVVDYPNWFSIPGEDHSIAMHVRQVLVRLQHQNIWTPAAKQVAALLNVSSRTMRRQLEHENESFQSIKAQLRCELAVKQLLTTDLAISTIAVQVGFAEPGDFTRAFIKWTGEKPSVYRKTHAKKI